MSDLRECKTTDPDGAFCHYLRTGQGLFGSQTANEVKFNPWHDPDDGRFTFSGRGTYHGHGSRSAGKPASRYAKPPSTATSRRVSDVAAGSAPGTTDVERVRQRRGSPLSDPRNVAIYTVEAGDNLTRIARTRRGLSVSDLAWLNGIPADGTLRVGQKLRVPTQAFLDAGKAARDNFLNLEFYRMTHGGKLPPDLTRVPSILTQIDTEMETVVRNGYTYKIDSLLRFRRVYGDLQDGPTAKRSRRAQLEAGGKDRLSTDDGGHYVGVQFNGPRDWFNHFAQDANFNRGIYRVLERTWLRELRAGRKVFVDIVPHYSGLSRRPDKLSVTWFVDGQRHFKEFPNERRGRKNDR